MYVVCGAEELPSAVVGTKSNIMCLKIINRASEITTPHALVYVTRARVLLRVCERVGTVVAAGGPQYPCIGSLLEK